MGYDDDRERRRMNREDEYRRGDFDRFSRGYRTTGWPGESSWGYGREYDERFPPRYERPYEEVSETFSPSERFEDSGRPDRTGGATEFHPQIIHRHSHSPYGPGSLGWQAEGGFGQGSGYLYGWSPGEQGYENPTFRTPERWRSAPLGYGASYYGTSSHLMDVPRGRERGARAARRDRRNRRPGESQQAGGHARRRSRNPRTETPRRRHRRSVSGRPRGSQQPACPEGLLLAALRNRRGQPGKSLAEGVRSPLAGSGLHLPLCVAKWQDQSGSIETSSNCEDLTPLRIRAWTRSRSSAQGRRVSPARSSSEGGASPPSATIAGTSSTRSTTSPRRCAGSRRATSWTSPAYRSACPMPIRPDSRRSPITGASRRSSG